MTHQYPISVIIPTFNRARLLGYTLRSLELQQLSKNNFEVIVSDDGSNDNTQEVVNQFRDKLNIRYVFQEDKGYRPASARNKGILHAKGEICLFLDSGILADDQCLQAHVDIHQAAVSQIAAIGYVYGFDQEGTENDIRPLIDVDNPANTIRKFQQTNFCPDIREPHYQKYNDRLEDLPAPWILFWTCNVSAKRSALMEVGMFDEKFDGNWGCEDNDLGIRLQQHHVKIVLNRKAQSIHFPHEKDMQEKTSQGYANCLYLHQKFNSVETAIFLQNYLQLITNEFLDINELIEAELRNQPR